MSAAANIFIIDFVFRTFAKIYEKMPYFMLSIVLVMYGIVAYMVIKSAYLSDHDY